MTRSAGCALALLLVACAGSTNSRPRSQQAPQSEPTSALDTGAGSGPRTAPPTIAASASVGAETSPPVPPAAPALVPIPRGSIGGPGAVQVLAASTSGAWVELCQGRPPSKVLVIGAGSGEPIDDVYAEDPSGRHLVVARGTSVDLIDTLTSARTDLTALGADVRRARADYAAHRTLGFSSDGARLAYVRRSGSQSWLVVRTLADAGEREIALTGEVFRLKLSADSRFVSLDLVREDTNQNGKLDWPAPEEPRSSGSCAGSGQPKLRSFSHQGRGDALTHAVVGVESGVVREAPELVTTLGTSLLLRAADGSLKLEQRERRLALAPADCAGRVLFGDAARELALIACTLPKKPGKRQVWLLGAGYAKNLNVELYETATDREAVTATRLVPLYPGSEAALVDLERKDLLPLAAGSRVLAVSGELALIWRGSELLRYDARTKTEQSLAKGVAKNPDLLRAGSALLLSPFVFVDIATPPLASPTARPLALSASGYVLAASEPPPAAPDSRPEAIEGPLHWLDARVPLPDGPPR